MTLGAMRRDALLLVTSALLGATCYSPAQRLQLVPRRPHHPRAAVCVQTEEMDGMDECTLAEPTTELESQQQRVIKILLDQLGLSGAEQAPLCALLAAGDPSAANQLRSEKQIVEDKLSSLTK